MKAEAFVGIMAFLFLQTLIVTKGDSMGLSNATAFLIVVCVVCLIASALMAADLRLRKPKFKVGDKIWSKPVVGEFGTKFPNDFHVITRVGKKSYLVDFYWASGRLISKDMEVDISTTDRVYEFMPAKQRLEVV